MFEKKNNYTDTKLIKPIKKYAFVFVCQKGRIEIESLFLVASLKKFVKFDYEIIAALPKPKSIFGEISNITLDFFNKMGVRTETFTNDFIIKAAAKGINIDPKENKALFLANKAYALQIRTSADKIIFVDSDMIFHEEFTRNICFSIPFNAYLAGPGLYKTSSGKWDQIFKEMGVNMPNLRVKLNRENEGIDEYTFTPSFFNNSFYGIRTSCAKKLSKIWIKFSKKIFFQQIIKNFNKTGEVPFNLALYKAGIIYNILNLDWKHKPYFHYYSDVNKLKYKPKIIDLAKSIIKEHPEIKDLISDNKEWAFILE